MGKTYFVDFFNTTVFRKESAKDVLFAFATALGEECSLEPAAIYNLFLKHQTKLTVEKWKTTGEAEYRFEEIMERVAEDLFRKYDGEGKEAFLRAALPAYINTELKGLRLNEELVSFLRREKTRGGGVPMRCRNSIAAKRCLQLG